MPGATQFNTQYSPGIFKVGSGPLTKRAAVLAIIGTIFASNFVGKSTTSSFIVQDQAILTPQVAFDTGSGGLATVGTDLTYDTIVATSPFDSDAASRGLKTGTGVVWMLVFDLIKNPQGASFDCTRTRVGAKAATGGTLLANNVTATGTTTVYSTPFTLGPTEEVKCATRTTLVNRNFSGSLKLLMTHSNVVN